MRNAAMWSRLALALAALLAAAPAVRADVFPPPGGSGGAADCTADCTFTGTTVMTGAASIGGTLTLGTGGTSGQRFQASGTGNWVWQMGGPASILNIINSSSVSLLAIGGSGNTVSVQTQLVLPNTKTWVGASAGSNSTIYQNANWSGAPGGNISANLNMWQVFDGIDTGAGGEVNVIFAHGVANVAGFTGQRHAGMFIQDITAAPAGTGGTYTGLNSKANGMVNVGGTGTTAGTAAGAVFGENPVAHLGPAATNWSGLVGVEVNTWSETGSTMMDRIGIQVVDIGPGGGARAARDDVALSLNNQYAPGASLGFKVGLGFGRAGGFFPVATDGTLIAGQGQLGGAWTVTHGIDWSLGTATGNWLRFGSVFTVSGAGATTIGGSLGVTGATSLTSMTAANAVTITGTLTTIAPAVAQQGLTAGTNTASSALTVNGQAGANRNFRFSTAGLPRVQFTLNTSAEAGSNAGSDLDVVTFDDTGAALVNPAIRVTRANGRAFFFGGLGLPGTLGLTVSNTTVALLPTCNAGAKGLLSVVSDATAPTYNATLTGGGAVSVPAYCNGTNWTAH